MKENLRHSYSEKSEEDVVKRPRCGNIEVRTGYNPQSFNKPGGKNKRREKDRYDIAQAKFDLVCSGGLPCQGIYEMDIKGGQPNGEKIIPTKNRERQHFIRNNILKKRTEAPPANGQREQSKKNIGRFFWVFRIDKNTNGEICKKGIKAAPD